MAGIESLFGPYKTIKLCAAFQQLPHRFADNQGTGAVLRFVKLRIKRLTVRVCQGNIHADGVKLSFTLELGQAIDGDFCIKGILYDPTKAEEPDITSSAEDRDLGGLGIFMTKKLTNFMEYSNENGSNCLTVKVNF